MGSRNPGKNIVSSYKYGFSKPEEYVFKSEKGLNEEKIRQISAIKNEPKWMLDFRLKAYEIFLEKEMPSWGVDLSEINFDDIFYYLKPIEGQKQTWEELPESIKDTYDKLGIPEAERKFLAGVSAQYESEVVYHSLIKELEAQGVIFTDMDTGLREHEELVKKYFGKLVPSADNKFAALNSAVWSGGSFIYVPKGVKVSIPLQAYFRINAKNMGQFERTLIIADEGSFVHYIEGCFVAGAKVRTIDGEKEIQNISIGDKVLTHKGRFRKVNNVFKRTYKGLIYKVKYHGNFVSELRITEEHPILVARKEQGNSLNNGLMLEWTIANRLRKDDYLVLPIQKNEIQENILVDKKLYAYQFSSNKNFKDETYVSQYRLRLSPKISFIDGSNRHKVNLNPELFRLFSYFIAAGSLDKDNCVQFIFNKDKIDLIQDISEIIKKHFDKEIYIRKIYKNYIVLTLSTARIAKLFVKEFGSTVDDKKIPNWILESPIDCRKEFLKGLWLLNGSFDKNRELFKIVAISSNIANAIQQLILGFGIIAAIDIQKVKLSRQNLFDIVVASISNTKFGDLVNINCNSETTKEDTHFYIDENYLYLPIKSIQTENFDGYVYNLSVEEDETYVAEGVVSHNCTAPVYSTDSLHCAVVEIFCLPGSRVRYTTVQNWAPNVYNLVTKRAVAEENAIMEWIDGNIGSKKTMKYPSIILKGENSKGIVVSAAYAGKNQEQDTGTKIFHLAPNTSSEVTAKSVSQYNGKTTYRGMISIGPNARNSKVSVKCDALLLDDESQTDTIPVNICNQENVEIEHEASVSRMKEIQLQYLRSRGISEDDARSMVVNGFMDAFTRELPLEYAVELNRLIALNMEGSVG